MIYSPAVHLKHMLYKVFIGEKYIWPDPEHVDYSYVTETTGFLFTFSLLSEI